MSVDLNEIFSQYISNEQFKEALLLYEQNPTQLITKMLEVHLENNNFRTFIKEALRDGDKIEKRDDLSERDDLESLLKGINLKKQVENNKEILLKNDFIGESKDGKIGILDEDKNILRLNMNKKVGVNQFFSEEFEEDMKECILPSYEDILKVINENPDIYLDGIKKGYIRLLIEPYGQNEEEFYNIFSKWHDTSDNLKELGRKETVWFSDKQKEAIKNDSIKYNSTVTVYRIEGGLSRKEFLKTLKFPGFNVTFVQDILEIPKEDTGEVIGGEKQVECGKKIYEYFNNQKNIKLQRAWCVDFMRRVEEEKRILNRNTSQVTGNSNGKEVFIDFWSTYRGRVALTYGYPETQGGFGGAAESLEVY